MSMNITLSFSCHSSDGTSAAASWWFYLLIYKSICLSFNTRNNRTKVAHATRPNIKELR